MKALRRTVIALLVFTGIGLTASIVAGLFFQQEMHDLAIHELSKRLHADISLRQTDVHFIRSFPNISIELKDLRLNAVERTDSIDFIYVPSTYFQVDFLSFFSRNYRIKSIKLDDPEIYLRKDAEGEWNYSGIFKKEGQDEKSDTLAGEQVIIDLTKVKIVSGSFQFRDLSKDFRADVKNISANLKGAFTRENFHAKGDIDFYFDQLSAKGKTYFSDRNVALNLNLDSDFSENPTFDISNSELRVGDLILALDGKVEVVDGMAELKLKCQTNRNSFEGFFAIIPATVLDKEKFKNIKGELMLNGSVEGKLGKGKLPLVMFDFQVINGGFEKQNNKVKFGNISMEGRLKWNPVNERNSLLDISKVTARINGKALSGSFQIKNFSHPHLSSKMKGKFELKDLAEIVSAERAGISMHGSIDFDLALSGSLSNLKKKNFSALKMTGSLKTDIAELSLRSMAHPLKLTKTAFEVSGNKVLVRTFNGTTGSSDFKVTGSFTGLVPFILDSTAKLSAKLNLISNKLDIDDIIPKSNANNKTKLGLLPEVSPRFVLHLEAAAEDFHYEGMYAKVNAAHARLSNAKMEIHQMDLSVFEGNVLLNGTLVENKDKSTNADLAFRWKDVDVHQALDIFSQWGDITLMEDHLYGNFSGTMKVKNRIDVQRQIILSTLDASGESDIYDGQVLAYEPMQRLAGFVKIDKLKNIKFDDIHTEFSINKNYFNLKEMSLSTYDYKIKVEGRHSLDNILEYDLEIDVPKFWAKDSKSSQVNDLVDEVSNVSASLITLPIKVRGTVDDPEFSLNKKVVKEKIKDEVREERKEMTEGSKKEVEDVFGKQDTSDVDDWIEVEEKEDKPLIQFGNLFKRRNKNPENN